MALGKQKPSQDLSKTEGMSDEPVFYFEFKKPGLSEISDK